MGFMFCKDKKSTQSGKNPYLGSGKRQKHSPLWFVQNDRKTRFNFVEKGKNFFKKYLKFTGGCVIIYKLTSDATKREVAIAPIFPGVYGEFPRSKSGLKPGEGMRETKPFFGNCAAGLRKPVS